MLLAFGAGLALVIVLGFFFIGVVWPRLAGVVEPRGERQAHITGGAEGRTGHEGDAGFVEQVLGQSDVVADTVQPVIYGLEVRKTGELAVGRQALDRKLLPPPSGDDPGAVAPLRRWQ